MSVWRLIIILNLLLYVQGYAQPIPFLAQKAIQLKIQEKCVPKPTKFDSTRVDRRTVGWLLFYDCYTTITANHHLHPESSSDVNYLYYYYNLDLKNKLSFRSLSWDMYLFNDYGLRHFFDSITLKTQDQLTCNNAISAAIISSKLNVTLAVNQQTKLWNTYIYLQDAQGNYHRTLYENYMSPGTILYTGGLTWQAPGHATVLLGLGSSKITKIRDQRIFESRQQEEIEGVLKGSRKKSEFGFVLCSTIPLQPLSKHIHWEFYENLFVPSNRLTKPNYFTFELNNVFHFIVLKHLRISFRTKVNYNKDRQDKVSLQNQLSLGLYLNNHL